MFPVDSSQESAHGLLIGHVSDDVTWLDDVMVTSCFFFKMVLLRKFLSELNDTLTQCFSVRYVYTRGVQPFWPEGQVYKFQSSRGPDNFRHRDRDAEGIGGGRKWVGGVPLPSRLGVVGECRKLPQWGPGWSPGRSKRVLAYFRA